MTLDPFGIEMVSTLARQFIDNLGFVSPSTSNQQRANSDDGRLKRM